MAEQTYHGGCHCGAVRYSAALDLERGTIRCNCSLCSKSRAWFAFAPEDQFKLEGGTNGLITYRWTPPGKSEPNLSYHTCSNCGVRTHAVGIGPGGARTVARPSCDVGRRGPRRARCRHSLRRRPQRSFRSSAERHPPALTAIDAWAS
jgi:hypothetical protein